MPIKGILFDKDGTLLDFEKTWFRLGERMALRAADGNREKADALLALSGYDFATQRFRPDSIFAVAANVDIVTLWFPTHSKDERAMLLADFEAIATTSDAAQPVAFPETVGVVTQLHAAGYVLGIATNDSEAGARRALDVLGIADKFAFAVGYDSVRRPKPQPDMVEAFCAATGLLPAEIAVVGDNRHDLEMGRAGGVGLIVGVLSGTGTRETLTELADVVMESVADLPEYLRQKGWARTN